MKKLLALFVVGGLLGLITGCPPSSSSTGTGTGIKTTGTTIKETKSGGEKVHQEKKTEEVKPNLDKPTGDNKKVEEKKTEEVKPGGEKKVEEKKTEEKKK